MQTKSEKLYKKAFDTIGFDASPKDLVSDEYACAESVSTILSSVIAFNIITGTFSLLNVLKDDSRFQEIFTPEQGCIIISATGTGNGNLANGHVGIVGKNLAPDNSLYVMSNSSASGIWSVNLTIDKWNKYYGVYGGFPVRYFKLLG